jgi:hypothetical protein
MSGNLKDRQAVMTMPRYTSLAFQQTFAAIGEHARREPVAITGDGQDKWVVLAAEEYAHLMRRDRKVYTAGSLPDEWLEAVEAAGPTPRPSECRVG